MSFTFNITSKSYIETRNSEIKIQENAPLFKNSPAREIDLSAHYDGKKNLAVGYGFDFLVRSVESINNTLSSVGAETLNNEQVAILNKAKDLSAINGKSGSASELHAIAISLGLNLDENSSAEFLYRTILDKTIVDNGFNISSPLSNEEKYTEIMKVFAKDMNYLLPSF
ncbi:hypothetical protein [Endozoicomonas numazuensis]|uniref:Uncharacterized protein n=1 Tax=Endozoicomonas numazuensis TaxID=1137799 RepID=A0A081NHM8_9GAMM|nr:hypothetical protein [Endozoicomonas numazuensis]KEQ17951.1 hypothetical protein GZ78_10055 [Endozoicomonas numazuensis]